MWTILPSMAHLTYLHRSWGRQFIVFVFYDKDLEHILSSGAGELIEERYQLSADRVFSL